MRALLAVPVATLAALSAMACQQVTDPQPSDAGAPDAADEIPDASIELEASTELTSRVEH